MDISGVVASMGDVHAAVLSILGLMVAVAAAVFGTKGVLRIIEGKNAQYYRDREGF